MTTHAAPAALAERADVHKSCRALEAVVNLLNDYCEAAGAVVQLQKKLSKALRDAAVLKCTGEIAANALHASAAVFEVLSDTDVKFAKVADKECDGISSEVKKWFKKLAKEEKAHDDRIASTNVKIKQAGLAYEKKARKNTRDAAEEHSRYIALLGAVGPEMSQDKYNHALFVTQRQVQMTFNVAGCLARVADAEWLRSCEEVRRFAPAIGHLGEWRALCEGGWTGTVPKDLPEVDPIMPRLPPGRAITGATWTSEPEDRPSMDYSDMEGSRTSRDADRSRGYDSQGESAPQRLLPPVRRRADSNAQNPTTSSEEQSRPPSSMGQNLAPEQEFGGLKEQKDYSSTSLASLAAFPSPPTHFPLPPVTSNGHRPSPSLGAATHSPNGDGAPSDGHLRRPQLSATVARPLANSFVTLPSLAESPAVESSLDAAASGKDESAPQNGQERDPVAPTLNGASVDAPAERLTLSKDVVNSRNGIEIRQREAQIFAESGDSSSREPSSPIDRGVEKASSSGSSSFSGAPPGAFRRGDYMVTKEFGVQKPSGDPKPISRSLDGVKTKGVERSDSAKSYASGMPAARGRYTHTTAPASPPPRDIPKLPLSVSEIANRYKAADNSPPAPLRRATSPPSEVQTLASTAGRYRVPDSTVLTGRQPLSASLNSTSDVSSPTIEDYMLRRQHVEGLEDPHLREREYELHQRERDIEQQVQELERERARFKTSQGPGRSPGRDGYASDTARSNASPRPYHPPQPYAGPQESRYSNSATHLIPPPPASSRAGSSSSQSQSYAQSEAHSQQSPAFHSRDLRDEPPPSDHAPFCGCHACSVAKYRHADTAPSPRDLRPPEPPIMLRPEKPKGWMRRLSMPVISNPLSSDSKKSPGHSNRNSVGYIMEDARMGGPGRQRYEPDAVSNRSATNLARR